MSPGKISILLPCLDERPFLQPRIDSLLGQTYSNWEAIVLDGGSTDGSWELWQTIGSKDPHFQVHQLGREGGLYAALNRGMEKATGEFVHVATCDDTAAPDFFFA